MILSDANAAQSETESEPAKHPLPASSMPRVIYIILNIFFKIFENKFNVQNFNFFLNVLSQMIIA